MEHGFAKEANGSKVSAKIEGLQPATAYQCRLVDAGSLCWASLPSRQRLPHHYIMVISICGIKMGKHGMPGEAGHSFWDTSNPGTTTGLGAVVNINPTQRKFNGCAYAGWKICRVEIAV